MSRARPHAKSQRSWFPCAGSVPGSGSRCLKSTRQGPSAEPGRAFRSRGPGPCRGLVAEGGEH